jgi:predicted RNA-binding protein YlxR (DUF448 family)
LRIALIRDAGARPRAVIDRDGTLPGRGAYVCREPRADAPMPACMERARRNRGIARTLRAAVGIDGELLESVGR